MEVCSRGWENTRDENRAGKDETRHQGRHGPVPTKVPLEGIEHSLEVREEKDGPEMG